MRKFGMFFLESCNMFGFMWKAQLVWDHEPSSPHHGRLEPPGFLLWTATFFPMAYSCWAIGTPNITRLHTLHLQCCYGNISMSNHHCPWHPWEPINMADCVISKLEVTTWGHLSLRSRSVIDRRVLAGFSISFWMKVKVKLGHCQMWRMFESTWITQGDGIVAHIIYSFVPPQVMATVFFFKHKRIPPWSLWQQGIWMSFKNPNLGFISRNSQRKELGSFHSRVQEAICFSFSTSQMVLIR